jgi:hypothetical protein
MVTEEAHPLVPADVARRHNYGVYTARYGNLYTPRQLLQLFQRAYGLFKPVDDLWIGDNGRYLDPYRPTVEPAGFSCEREFQHDRERHFAAVRKAFEQSSIFVFTFGLTEAFINKADGAVYPICPGVAGGQFDHKKHVFKNFTVQEITADFLKFVDLVRKKNRALKFIITVSPVPLAATAENRSVIASTVYSKAVLRVACDEIAAARPNVAYFPSFEIVTGNFARGKYFADDNRTVTDAGVAHVMKVFMRHFAGTSSPMKIDTEAAAEVVEYEKLQTMLDLICAEELLDQPPSGTGVS